MAWTSIADDHISLHAGNLTAADIPKVIQTRLNTQDGHRIARLGVGHNPIGDRGTTELLQWLGAEGRKVEQPLWVRQALEEGDVSPRDEAEQSGETSTGDSERASSDAIQEHPSDEQGPGLPPVPPSSPHAYIALRHLVLEGSGIGNDGLKAIAGYVRGNGALTRLDLQGNQIGDDPSSIQLLSSALRSSTLRVLHLGNNPLGAATLIAFLSTLPPSGLRELHLSLVVPPESTTPEEGLESADAVADYLRDGRRCRALEKLTLNGNTFGWTGVRVIVGAIVSLPSASGARRGGNRTVSHVELFATGADAPDPDEGDTSFGEGAGTGTGARTRSTRRRSMTEYFIARRREHRAERKMRRAAAVVGGGGGRLSQPSSDDEEREDIRSGNAKFITRDNWRKLLGETVWANAQRSVRTRSSARALLGPARVLGCCVRQGDGDNGGGGGAAAAKGAGAGPHFPFMRLPPELRVQILRHLDDKRSLNDLQFLTVLSWACERSTIGYGSESRIPFSLRSFDSASTTSNSAANAIATLFAPTWSWPSAVRTHSIPRDWPAEVLDSGASSSVAGPARPEYGPWYTGEDGAWTVISPALWAFWECTGTRMGWER